MMRGGGHLLYASGSGWQAVELPYVGDQLAMDIILPKDLAAFGATLDSKAWDAIVKALAEHPVDLSLPRFSTETKTDLASTLSAMGMPDAFTGKADFTGITTEEPIQISAVIHQPTSTLTRTARRPRRPRPWRWRQARRPRPARR